MDSRIYNAFLAADAETPSYELLNISQLAEGLSDVQRAAILVRLLEFLDEFDISAFVADISHEGELVKYLSFANLFCDREITHVELRKPSEQAKTEADAASPNEDECLGDAYLVFLRFLIDTFEALHLTAVRAQRVPQPQVILRGSEAGALRPRRHASSEGDALGLFTDELSRALFYIRTEYLHFRSQRLETMKSRDHLQGSLASVRGSLMLARGATGTSTLSSLTSRSSSTQTSPTSSTPTTPERNSGSGSSTSSPRSTPSKYSPRVVSPARQRQSPSSTLSGYSTQRAHSSLRISMTLFKGLQKSILSDISRMISKSVRNAVLKLYDNDPQLISPTLRSTESTLGHSAHISDAPLVPASTPATSTTAATAPATIQLSLGSPPKPAGHGPAQLETSGELEDQRAANEHSAPHDPAPQPVALPHQPDQIQDPDPMLVVSGNRNDHDVSLLAPTRAGSHQSAQITPIAPPLDFSELVEAKITNYDPEPHALEGLYYDEERVALASVQLPPVAAEPAAGLQAAVEVAAPAVNAISAAAPASTTPPVATTGTDSVVSTSGVQRAYQHEQALERRRVLRLAIFQLRSQLLSHPDRTLSAEQTSAVMAALHALQEASGKVHSNEALDQDRLSSRLKLIQVVSRFLELVQAKQLPVPTNVLPGRGACRVGDVENLRGLLDNPEWKVAENVSTDRLRRMTQELRRGLDELGLLDKQGGLTEYVEKLKALLASSGSALTPEALDQVRSIVAVMKESM